MSVLGLVLTVEVKMRRSIMQSIERRGPCLPKERRHCICKAWSTVQTMTNMCGNMRSCVCYTQEVQWPFFEYRTDASPPHPRFSRSSFGSMLDHKNHGTLMIAQNRKGIKAGMYLDLGICNQPPTPHLLLVLIAGFERDLAILIGQAQDQSLVRGRDAGDWFKLDFELGQGP